MYDGIPYREHTAHVSGVESAPSSGSSGALLEL